MESPGSFGISWVNLGASRGGRIHSGSRGFPVAGLGVVVFIPDGVGSILRV